MSKKEEVIKAFYKITKTADSDLDI